jgi:hypothetical protein
VNPTNEGLGLLIAICYGACNYWRDTVRKMLASLALMVASPCFAAATSNGSLSLSWSLTDLNPNDGVAAALNFQFPYSGGHAGLAGAGSPINDVSADALDALSVSVGNMGPGNAAWATLTRQPQTITLASFGQASGLVANGGELRTAFVTNIGALSQYTLSNNTRVDWTLSYALSGQTDGLVKNLPDYADPQTERVNGNASWRIDGESAQYQLGDSGSFSLSFSNVTGADYAGNIAMGVDLSGQGLVPIPEPETYALMGLGLLALGIRGSNRWAGRQ